MSTVEDLMRARELVEAGHCTWAMAKTGPGDNGDPVPAHHPKAASFCIYGALEKVAWEKVSPVCSPGLAAAALRDASSVLKASLPPGFRADPSIGGGNLCAFNNVATKAEVLALFDRAIAFEGAPQAA